MSHMKDVAKLTQQYLKEAHNRERTIEWILQRPHWEQVWMSWHSMAHFKQDHHYNRIEGAPEGLESIKIVGKSIDTYRWNGTEYVRIQEFSKELCKAVYGD